MMVYFGRSSGGDGSRENPYNSVDDFLTKHQPKPHEPLEFCFLEDANISFSELLNSPSVGPGTFESPIIIRGYLKPEDRLDIEKNDGP